MKYMILIFLYPENFELSNGIKSISISISIMLVKLNMKIY